MKDIDSRKDKFFIILAVYTFGVFFGMFLYTLRVINRICSSWGVKVLHKERLRLPKNKRGFLIVSNHPSLLEPILIPCLFFWKYILHPLNLSPWGISDRKNYNDKWYWFWLKLRLIPIDRENGKSVIKSLRKIKKILELGGIVFLFPEGGRTCKGKSFSISEKGNRLRMLREGVGWLILKSNPLVIPIWIDGSEKTLPNNRSVFPRFWHKTIIRIGEALHINGDNKKEITEKVVSTILELADQGE